MNKQKKELIEKQKFLMKLMSSAGNKYTLDDVSLISGIGSNRNDLLVHFIPYYKRLGIQKMYMLVHIIGSKKDENECLSILEKEGIQYETYRSDIWNPNVQMEHVWKLQAMVKTFWVLHVDVDELVRFNPPIKYLINSEYDYVKGKFIDRFTADGILALVKENIPLETQFPVKNEFSKKVMHSYTSKPVIYKHNIRLKTVHFIKGEHVKNYKMYPIIQDINHYKWDAGVIERLDEKLRKKVRENCWPESEIALSRINGNVIDYRC